MFAKLDEELKAVKAPAWLSVDADKQGDHVSRRAVGGYRATSFSTSGAVLEFYTR